MGQKLEERTTVDNSNGKLPSKGGDVLAVLKNTGAALKENGIHYHMGDGHGERESATNLRSSGDCSWFASYALARINGHAHFSALATGGFASNPFGYPTTSAEGVKRLQEGQVVQFNWTGKSYGHTGFFFKDTDGKLKVMDLRGGHARTLVIEDASRMLACAERHGAKFFVIDSKGKSIQDFGSVSYDAGYTPSKDEKNQIAEFLSGSFKDMMHLLMGDPDATTGTLDPKDEDSYITQNTSKKEPGLESSTYEKSGDKDVELKQVKIRNQETSKFLEASALAQKKAFPKITSVRGVTGIKESEVDLFDDPNNN